MINESTTLTNFMADCIATKGKIQNGEAITKEYAEQQKLLNLISNGYSFLVGSTRMSIVPGVKGLYINTIMPAEKYYQALQALTNNMDTEFITYVVNETRTDNEEELTAKQVCGMLQTALDEPYVQKEYEDFLQVQELAKNYTGAENAVIVKELYHQINCLNLLAEDAGVNLYTDTDKEQIFLLAQANVDVYHTLGKSYELTNKSEIVQAAIKKNNEGLEVVESNDGYVMNTNLTPELAAEEPGLQKKYNEIVKDGIDINELIEAGLKKSPPIYTHREGWFDVSKCEKEISTGISIDAMFPIADETKTTKTETEKTTEDDMEITTKRTQDTKLER